MSDAPKKLDLQASILLMVAFVAAILVFVFVDDPQAHALALGLAATFGLQAPVAFARHKGVLGGE